MRKNCLFMIMFAEGVQKGKIPPCRIGYLISVSNRDTNKSRVPNTFWTPSSFIAYQTVISFNNTTLYSPLWLPDIFLPDHKKWHNYLPYVRVQALLFPEMLFYH